MISAGLTAPAAAAAPTASTSAAPSINRIPCYWVPPQPRATTTDPIGHPAYPCGPASSPSSR
jgi:hypothetical protein